MSARNKINSLVVCGVLILSGGVGLVTGSGWAFTITATGLLVAAFVSRDVRLR